ncbi:hypothetical protein BDCR2A_01378, partial [Borrelia duttonii CR2A]
MNTFGRKSIFLDDECSFNLDNKNLKKIGFKDLLPYKLIDKNELKNEYYMASREIWTYKGDKGYVRVKEEVTCKMHKFETTMRISKAALMNDTLIDDNVKYDLALNLMKNVYYSIVFGKTS